MPTAVNGFACMVHHGPHHGELDCVIHMRRERWVYGRLTAWITLEAYHYWKQKDVV